MRKGNLSRLFESCDASLQRIRKGESHKGEGKDECVAFLPLKNSSFFPRNRAPWEGGKGDPLQEKGEKRPRGEKLIQLHNNLYSDRLKREEKKRVHNGEGGGKKDS